jgi:hypothetical protein
MIGASNQNSFTAPLTHQNPKISTVEKESPLQQLNTHTKMLQLLVKCDFLHQLDKVNCALAANEKKPWSEKRSKRRKSRNAL